MRRRSRSIRILGIAVLVGFASLALFTHILLPAQRLILDGLAAFVLGIGRFDVPLQADAGAELEGKVRVIARRADEFQNVFVISASVSEGAKIVSDGALVGVVITQGRISSRVEAVTSPGFIIHGIVSRSGIPAEFQGKGAMLMEARLPRGTDVSRGDVVVEDGGTPLVLGTVADVVDIPSDPFVTVVVQNPVNLTTLSGVEVIEETPRP